jgi:uncharacterized protein involved in outer membrane biogenesis
MLKKLLLLISTTLTLLLAGGLFLLFTIDLGDYRDYITEAVEEHTGRKVTLGDDIRFSLLPQPRLVVTDIRLANAPWGATPDMLTIRRLDAELKLRPLFSGDIVIKRIGLHDAALWLERSRSGEGNWQFDNDQSSDTQLPNIEQLAINNLTLGWRNHRHKETQRLELSLAVLRKQKTKETLQLELRGSYRGKPFQLGAGMHPPQLGAEQTRIKLEEMSATLGSSDINGNFTLDLHSARKPRITADLHSNKLRPEDFYTPEKESKKQSNKVFSRKTLPISVLQPWEGAVTYRAKSLRSNQFAVNNLRLNFQLEKSNLTANWSSGKSTKARLRINAAAQPPRVNLTYSVKDLELAELVRSGNQNGPLSGRGDLFLKLQGRGDSIAALMASLNGDARLLAGKGRLHIGDVDSLTGGVWSVLGTLTAKDSSSAVMNCLASDFQIKNGIATSRAFLIDSEHSTLFGNGSVNLGRERINFLFEPTPKTATLNVAVPVKVEGPLTNPGYRLEKSQAARKAIGVVGLFVFPPAALIGLGELGTGEENPCLRIAREGVVSARKPQSLLERSTSAASETLQNSKTAVTETLDESKKAVQGTLQDGQTAVKETYQDSKTAVKETYQDGKTAVKDTLHDAKRKVQGLFGD